MKKQFVNPAQVTSKHKHFCCPCPKWADFVYSLILGLPTGLCARGFLCNLAGLLKITRSEKNNVLFLENFLYDEEQKQFSEQKFGKCS